jgi:insertion element IS1 protein InsB
LIDWECGDQMTFERLLARLRRWKVRLICTDEYVVYQDSLSAGRHYAGKDQTVALERTHSRLRHWLARFRRRTVSRSKEMVDCSIALVAHLHINQEVDPSFFHLPLARATA